MGLPSARMGNKMGNKIQDRPKLAPIEDAFPNDSVELMGIEPTASRVRFWWAIWTWQRFKRLAAR